MPAERTPAQRRLIARLVALAEGAGVSQRDIAREARVSQSSISRTWAGARVPVKAEVRAWLGAVDATVDERDEVWALFEASARSSVAWDDADPVELQRGAGELARESTLVCSYQQTIVPGWLQTASYARVVKESAPGVPDVGAAVAAVLDTQAVLYEAGRRWRFVLAEHVLADLDAAQAARLDSVATLDTVDLRVLPDEAARYVAPPHSFTLFDGPELVVIELHHDQVTVRDADQLDDYRRHFSELADLARAW